MRLKLIYIEFTVCLIWHIAVLLAPSGLVLLDGYNFHLLGMYHLVQLLSLSRNRVASCHLRIRILFKTNMPWREVVKWIVSMLVVVVILLYHCLITGYCWLLAWDWHGSYWPFDQPVLPDKLAALVDHGYHQAASLIKQLDRIAIQQIHCREWLFHIWIQKFIILLACSCIELLSFRINPSIQKV